MVVEFPPFEHARFLAEAGTRPPRWNLGGSGYIGGSWKDRGIPAPFPADFDLNALNMVTPLDLRHAVADHVGTDPDRVLPTAGVSVANMAVIMDRVKPGCNVVCERPFYTPMPALAEGFGAELRYVDRRPDERWRLVPEDVAAVTDDDTALIMLTAPNNPTGQTMSAQDLAAFGDLAEEYDCVVLADQIFGELTDEPCGAALHPRIITTTGLNKTWGAGALRVGWIVGDRELLVRLETVHQHAVLAASPLGEHMAINLLGAGARCRQQLEERLGANHATYNAWAEGAGAEAGVVDVTASSLMAFPRLGGQVDTLAFARAARDEGICVVPGEFFGRAGHLRIGLGGPPNVLEEGLVQLSTIIEERTQVAL